MFFLARDQFGIKPLYYLSNEKGFSLSEIKSLKYFDEIQPNDHICRNFWLAAPMTPRKKLFLKIFIKSAWRSFEI